MPKATVIVELDLPSTFLVFCLRGPIDTFVAHNLDIIGFGTDEVYQKAPNDFRHPGRKNYYWNTVVPGPHIKLFEVWIELDVFAEKLDALRKRILDAVHHFLKGLSVLTLSHVATQRLHALAVGTEMSSYPPAHLGCLACATVGHTRDCLSDVHMSGASQLRSGAASTIQSLPGDQM